MAEFYDSLAPLYHLIYPDWDASIAHQAERLTAIIRNEWGPSVLSVLDVTCGIGTQSIGLARAGFEVKGSDLSMEAVSRAKVESAARGVTIPLSVCDVRAAFHHHGGGHDLVISCDNSLPHLLSELRRIVGERPGESIGLGRHAGRHDASARSVLHRIGRQIRAHSPRNATVRRLSRLSSKCTLASSPAAVA